MAKVKFIPCDIYKRGIIIFIGSLTELKTWVSKEYTDESERDFLNMIQSIKVPYTGEASFFYNNLDGQGIVLIERMPRTPREIGLLAHELLHATFHIMSFCHVEFTIDGINEAYTYLHEHLIRNALENECYKLVH